MLHKLNNMADEQINQLERELQSLKQKGGLQTTGTK